MRQKQYIDFLKNRLTQEEAQEFIEWLNSPEGEEQAMELIEQEWKNDDATDSINDVRLNVMLSKINEGIDATRVAKSIPWTNYLKIAAILLIGVAITFFVLDQTNTTPYSLESVLVTKSNPKGQKSTIFLPDGTKVYLNAESTLSYPQQFADNSRKVSIVGEAFFEVAEDESRPFTVYSDNFTTTAVGTSFNVRAYPDENILEVSLATGKVLVKDLNPHLDRGMFLLPGERMVYSEETDAVAKSSFDQKAALGWKEGLIYFKNSRFDEVVDKLSRWYDVSFTIINQPTGDWSYNGEFRNQSLQHVLMGMGLTKKFDYEIDGKSVVIRFDK